MILSTIIPISNFTDNYDNLVNIIKEIKRNETDLQPIFVLDTFELNAAKSLANLCESHKLEIYEILENSARNPGTSRNSGVKCATGEWVNFCDSDDLPNFSAMLLAIDQRNNNEEVIVGGYEVHDLKSGKIYTKTNHENEKSNLISISVYPGIWRWIIKNKLAQELKFLELSMGEDQCYLIDILSLDPEIFYSGEIFYRYRTGNQNSLTNKKTLLDDLYTALKFESSRNIDFNRYQNTINTMIISQIFTLIVRANLIRKCQSFFILVKFSFRLKPSVFFTSIRAIQKRFIESLRS